jgi:hypothetical protein
LEDQATLNVEAMRLLASTFRGSGEIVEDCYIGLAEKKAKR